ncbi:MAG: NAD(+)/NADH kinase [Lachnospiraceae bacterium]|nr:NAD(+)/NADH kinase [Lachnospiraceae bacterium]
MKNFLLITNKYKDNELSVTHRVVDYLKDKDAECQVLSELGSEYEELPELSEEVDCILVIGGDGTMLQAARVVAGKKIPMIGINKGTLGFLTEIEVSELEDALDQILSDDYQIEERMMLKGEIYHEGERVNQSLALNDLVITRSGISRIIECRIMVNGRPMNTFNGDGLIVSTPTGSTGYNLSAGGPVVGPNADIVLLTPICPHSLGVRSTVLAPTDDIWIEIGRTRKTQKEEAVATFDGQTGVYLTPGDRIHVRPAFEKLYLLKIREHNFYEILRGKLKKQQEV